MKDYLTTDERNFLKENMTSQVLQLKNALENQDFRRKKDIDVIHVMKEVDTDGNE